MLRAAEDLDARGLRPVGVGLVGCGRIARLFHLPVLASLDGVRLVGVADPDPQAAAAVRQVAPGAAVVPSVGDLLALDGVDAIVVCVPTDRHAEVACAALAAGRHVYVEKPLALDLAQAMAVVEARERAGTVGMVGFNLRFHPAYASARRLVAEGAVGSLVAIRTVFTAAPRPLPGWKLRRDTGGGALLDLGSHHVDLVRHLLGDEIVAVAAERRSVLADDDTALVTLVTAGSVAVQSLFSLSAAQRDSIEVHGTDGVLVADRYRDRRARVQPREPAAGRAGRLLGGLRSLAGASASVRGAAGPRPDPSFAAALAAFAAAARAGHGAPPDLTDGYRSLAVVLATERAASTGGTVAVDLPTPAGDGAAAP